MKVLVFGCNGLLGQNVLREAPHDIELILSGLEIGPVLKDFTAYYQVDITEKKQILNLIEKVSPDFIINCAAMTNVDLCESEKDLCQTINRDAVGWMAEPGVPMLHLSTDYVFDGLNGPYREEDKTNPLGYYGKTKLESEALVLSKSPDSIIVRTMLLWGRGQGLKTSFVDFVKSSLSSGKGINIVTDQVGSPTLAHELAATMWKMIELRLRGIFHVSGSECKSRFDWAMEIAQFYGLPLELIKPVLSSDLHQLAPRPLNSGFILEKMQSQTGMRTSNIRQQLQSIT